MKGFEAPHVKKKLSFSKITFGGFRGWLGQSSKCPWHTSFILMIGKISFRHHSLLFRKKLNFQLTWLTANRIYDFWRVGTCRDLLIYAGADRTLTDDDYWHSFRSLVFENVFVLQIFCLKNGHEMFQSHWQRLPIDNAYQRQRLRTLTTPTNEIFQSHWQRLPIWRLCCIYTCFRFWNLN